MKKNNMRNLGVGAMIGLAGLVNGCAIQNTQYDSRTGLTTTSIDLTNPLLAELQQHNEEMRILKERRSRDSLNRGLANATFPANKSGLHISFSYGDGKLSGEDSNEFYADSVIFVHANKLKYGGKIISYGFRTDFETVLQKTEKFIERAQNINDLVEELQSFSIPVFKSKMQEGNFSDFVTGTRDYFFDVCDSNGNVLEQRRIRIHFDKNYESKK